MTDDPLDVSKIILTAEQQSAFNKYKKADKVQLTEQEYAALSKRRLVLGSPWFGEKKFPLEVELNETGRQLLAYQLGQEALQRKAAMRYWITTGIAVLAFLMSALSLYLQISGNRDTPQPPLPSPTATVAAASTVPDEPEATP